MKYPVIVNCTKENKKIYKKHLRRFGLKWSGDYFYGRINSWTYENLSDFCSEKHLPLKIENDFSERNQIYRNTFFKNNPPHIGNSYFCAYCGFLVHKDKVTIDHIYPVAKVKKSPALQKRLRKHGINNVNDNKNLVAACKSCNQHKSAKMGKWIIKGKIGRHPCIWVIRHFIRISAISIVVCYFYKEGYFQLLYSYFKTGLMIIRKEF